MARQYQTKKFFRQAPNNLLKQYFKSQGMLTEVNFEELTETKIEPIYEAWLKIPEESRIEVERDFREINYMATEGGIKVIIDEAHFHGEDFSKKFSGMQGFHEHAFWTFLNHKECWRGAMQFYYADNIAQSYWRKRKNLPKVPANVDETSIKSFESAISSYYHKKEGRGKNCKVEYYRRRDLDYFFAYPEDYAQANIEWIHNEFNRRSHSPAFEVIFVYAEKKSTLDIYLRGQRKVVSQMQEIFASTILKSQLSEDDEDDRVYDLDPLLSKDFQFFFNPELGIEEISLKKMRFKLPGPGNRRVSIEVDPTTNPDVIYDLFEKAAKSLPLSHAHLTQVTIRAQFAPDHRHSKGKARIFNVSWPNSCSLKNDEKDLILRKMLSASGIEPQTADNDQDRNL